ncbi:Glycerophosphoryl diester phosphodiesterase [hydrothermal vent metagenome]|uniref:glycerophosphodiester phosphodiesterase n=1 Tax=hydrothermal vent metagenome TaxID=652676 RepID=A0A3B0RT01_9ZZZZ
MKWMGLAGLAAALLITSGCEAPSESAASANEKIMTLSGQRPIIIAHRGASGERPEHTLAAYQLAIDQGASFIEPDLVLTKDGVLVVRHENEISKTTDVSGKTEFEGRKTTKTIDGKKVTGWFTEDFTLAELKMLRAKERLADLRRDNVKYNGQFEIPTFEEVLQLLSSHAQKSGIRVGVYPETKHAFYFAGIGLPHEGPMLALLKQYGFDGADDPVFIQSFEVGNLKLLKQKTNIRLVQLVADKGGPPDLKDQSYANMLTPAGLSRIAKYAAGIGPAKSLVLSRDGLGMLDVPTGLVAAAHEAGLLVHPWTFRRENYFLPTNFKSGVDPTKSGDLEAEIRAYRRAGVDGFFSDNPAQVVNALDDGNHSR